MKISKHIFRQYDIRGVIDEDLTEESVYSLSKGLAKFYHDRNVNEIIIGYDARSHSPKLKDILVKGLNESGISVINIGMVPTPVLYYSQFNLNINGAIMITGSHNPPEYNGFKISYNKDSLHGDDILSIYDLIIKNDYPKGNGSVKNHDIMPEYINFIVDGIKPGNRKLKVVIDSGNGVGGLTSGEIFRRLGAEIIELYSEPDGTFPNHHPDPTIEKNMIDLINTVKKEKADLGIGYDGDADRIGAVDEKGNIIWGDQLMIIFSRAVLKDVPGATIIGEVKCSKTLYDDIKANGGNAIMWKVGHSLLKAKLKEMNAEFAGEMSGHIFFKHRFLGYDDAVYASCRLYEILSHFKGNASALLSGIPKMYNTPEIRIDCPDDRKFDVVDKLVNVFKKNYDVIDIDGARINFENGWGLVRASNTQPVLVSRFEADSEENLAEIRKIVEDEVKKLI